jgi:hypothetical protein
VLGWNIQTIGVTGLDRCLWAGLASLSWIAVTGRLSATLHKQLKTHFC